jgi:diguanylate cyclase (GGDEF)-like protein
LAFFLIGLDNFKYLNDLYGHKYGDELLRLLSDAFKSNFSKSDIYRWSGDEFLIMKEMNNHIRVDSVASEIMEITKRKWDIFDIAYRSSASVGVVLYPDNGDGPREIVANLDMALSHAKRSGKGQYQFVTDTFMQSIQYEAAMEKALKDAIAEDKLKLIAQPIVNMQTGKAVSLEMLLRWPDNPVSERNIGKVISFAEKTGLIIAIDKWVIENTLKIVKAYNGRAPELKFAINISVQSFHAKNFIDFMKKKLEEHQVNPSRIELEITEYSLVKDMDRSLGTINSIKALGVGIALDDFGTKFSSLNYLSKMPFDILKIDKSYVDQILNESKDLAIVKNVVNLSRDIGLSTIVEGIEVEEQRDMLVEIGCVYGQGYLFSRPKDIETIFEEFNM